MAALRVLLPVVNVLTAPNDSLIPVTVQGKVVVNNAVDCYVLVTV